MMKPKANITIDTSLIQKHQLKSTSIAVCFLMFCSLFFTSVQAQRQMENLGRGIVAVPDADGNVFISWRLLGTEPSEIQFNVYRGETKLNSSPIINSTHFVDKNAVQNEEYHVRAVMNGKEQKASPSVNVWNKHYKAIPINKPKGGKTPDGVRYSYTANDSSVGDLDGDGEYEIVLKWNPTNAKDNSHNGYTGKVYIDAYKLDGTQLWRIDLGKNIRAGAHYTQFIVYDLDGDGKAEIAMKTADGTKDGEGRIIGHTDVDYRNKQGRILSGPEFLSVFDGETGVELATTAYLPQRHPETHSPTPDQLNEVWGDGHGNRSDRFLAGVAYFDGERPSLLMTRGYYTRTVLATWDWRDGQLSQRWIFDSKDEGNQAYAAQGNHQLSIADVDEDGKDEVVFGAMTIDDDGTGLYSSELGHGDAMHVSNLDPDRPGLEIWSVFEDDKAYDGKGLWLRDAKTGKKLWGVESEGDIGRGLAADIDPRHKGYEMWGIVGGLYNAKGEKISDKKPKINFAVWWDADLSREILDGANLYKWEYESSTHQNIDVLEGTEAKSNNGTKKNPSLSADIFGDWREEMIFRNKDSSELLIFTTTIPTDHKLFTLMHDPQYRISIAWQNVAYNQPPHPSFYLGTDMEMPSVPDIILVKNKDE